ncbi:MAG: hypothetical protein NTZ35_15510 [Ignavibacteriales bacterium]|nr:hypothetical protein [Ignavibacteriales bacterium]
MNLGQTMITMGMFVLLVMSVISANRMLVQNAENSLQTEALAESATIANDIFSEAQSKLFDHNVDTTRTNQVPGDFSSPTDTTHSEWGPSSAERSAVGPMPDSSYVGHYRSINAFDDVDDYNGYTRIVGADTTSGVRIGGYLVTVRVFYVDLSNPDVAVDCQTNFKKIEVDVQHHPYLDFLPDEKLTYSSLMSY